VRGRGGGATSATQTEVGDEGTCCTSAYACGVWRDLPEEVEWKPFPAFPPSARLAVVVGEPSDQGLYTVRVRVPQGVKLMPHRHREDRVYTVISGIFYIGLGDRFVAAKLQAYPPGAVVVLPANTSHFHWAKAGEYVTRQLTLNPFPHSHRRAAR
jgi:quercetin dioxygenase-like cupin family protein